MQLINTTPYAVGYLLGRMHHPAPSLTVVVKATYHLRPGAPAVVASEQLPLAADTPDEDDAPAGLRYPADLVHYKPRADVLLVGNCHAGPAPVLRQTVRFRLGVWSKSLSVTGDRYWEVVGASAPVPFRAMPLEYDRAFGGADFPSNPVGRGLAPSTSPDGTRALWLPNVEEPERFVTSPGSRVPPAGFGPLRRNWAPRAEKLGTYDSAWLEQRWPWYPADFDWTHQNAAPRDMQLPFLRGDEPVVLSNLHPEHAELSSSLPGLRVRTFVGVGAAGADRSQLREVHMELDTLWIDAEMLTLVLVWRGVAEVASAEADEVSHLFVIEAPVAEAPSVLSAEQARFDALLDAQSREEPPDELAPDVADDNDVALELALTEAEKAADAQMRDAGLDPERLPVPSAEEKQEHAERLRALGVAIDEDEPMPWTRERVEEHAAQAGSFEGQDLSGLDLSGLKLTGLSFVSAHLDGANLGGATLESSVFDGASLVSCNLEQAALTGASFAAADLTLVNLAQASGANVSFDAALLEGASLSEARFTELSGARLSAAGANLSKAVLVGAKLSQANLSACQLGAADLRDADLSDASLEGAQGIALDARAANLTGLRAAEGSNFSGARFERVRARGSNWERATLSGASFVEAILDDANLAGAQLEKANLAGASLREATLRHANLREASFAGSNLFEAILEGVDGRGADFSGASLFGAETWNAQLGGARFAGANVSRTKLAR